MSESQPSSAQVPIPKRNSGEFASVSAAEPVSDAIQYAEYAALFFAAALLVAWFAPLRLPSNPLRWHFSVATHASEFAAPRYYSVLLLLVASAIFVLAAVFMLLVHITAGA
jgi:hypothetical protein